MKLCMMCHLQFGNEQEICPKDNIPLIALGNDPLLGTTIQQRYRLDAIIGRGAMGMVYLATQELIDRQVAIKVLHSHLVSESESLKRFHQQAKAASRLHHPHIVTLYDYGIIPGGQPYIAMDLLKGQTLAELLEEKGTLPLSDLLPIFKQICEALADAHKHGVVHRDVKPDNIVLETREDGKYWVKVVDFGIAKLMRTAGETQPRITKTGAVCGSPAYMSPEQYQGLDVDQASDIYSLGAVLFECLTGKLPFTSIDLVGLMSQHLTEAPPLLSNYQSGLPPSLEKMVNRALAKNPQDRQASMDDFYAELLASSKEPPKAMTVGTSGAPVISTTSDKIQARNLELRQTISEQTPLPVPVTPSYSQSRLPRSSPDIPGWLTAFSWLQILLPYLLVGLLLTAMGLILFTDSGLLRYMKQHWPSIYSLSQSSSQTKKKQAVKSGKSKTGKSKTNIRKQNR